MQSIICTLFFILLYSPKCFGLLQTIHRVNQLPLQNQSRHSRGAEGFQLVKEIHTVTSALDGMLENYDRRIRPNFYGPPVQVGITIFVKNLVSVSEYDMEYKLDFYLRQYWTDDRLQFNLTNPLSGEKIEVIGLSHEFSSQIWQPDTFFPNEKKSYIHSATVENQFIRLHQNGDILKSTRLTLTATCFMHLAYFPMDEQNCSVELESYGHSTRDIVYIWAHGNTSVKIGTSALTLPQFSVYGHRQSSRLTRITTGEYLTLYCEFLLVRSLNYYLMQVYIPAGLIVGISWLAFWMGRDAAVERMSIGVTTVLTISTLLLSTNSNSPKISYIKALDIYLAFCFSTVFASLLQSAVMGYLVKKMRDQEYKEEEMKRRKEKESTVETRLSESTSFNLQIPEGRTTTSENKSRKGSMWNVKCHYSVKIAIMDVMSRIIFPSGFLLFNFGYWVYYLNSMSIKRDEWDLAEKTG